MYVCQFPFLVKRSDSRVSTNINYHSVYLSLVWRLRPIGACLGIGKHVRHGLLQIAGKLSGEHSVISCVLVARCIKNYS